MVFLVFLSLPRTKLSSNFSSNFPSFKTYCETSRSLNKWILELLKLKVAHYREAKWMTFLLKLGRLGTTQKNYWESRHFIFT